MKKQLLLIFIFIFAFAISRSAFSQTNPCEIKLKDGKVLPRKRMVGLHDNFLLVADTGSYKIINIEKIANVRFEKGNFMWLGAAIGAGAGFLAGFAYYSLFNGTKGGKKFFPKDPTVGTMLVFTLPSAIIGGLIGMLFKNIDDYDLSKLNAFTKSKELKFIMRDHESYR